MRTDWSKRKGPDGRPVGDENLNLPHLVQDQRRTMSKDQQLEITRAEIDEIIEEHDLYEVQLKD